MELLLSILFIFLLAVWIGRQEIAYSFSGLHIREILSVRVFGAFLLAGLLLGMGVLVVSQSQARILETQNSFDLIASMLLSILLLNSLNARSSSITAFWGALLGVSYYQGTLTQASPIVGMALSILLAPVVGVCLTYLYNKWIERMLEHKERHLLVKLFIVKRTAVVGVILCGIALTYNYALLFDPLITSVAQSGSLGELPMAVIMLATCLLCFGCTIQVIGKGASSMKNINRHTASLYALITVILLLNLVAMPLLSPMVPVLVSANLVKECNNLFLDREKLQTHAVNIVTISLLTPLLAFLVSMQLASVSHDLYWESAVVMFIVLLCVLTHLYFNQYVKHRRTQKALSAEHKQKEEVGRERNRLDVVAVTSQFNVISKEIDLKQRELINLSLYIKQQRDYLEEIASRLVDSTRLDDIQKMRKAVRTQVADLRDNVRLTDEMDQFYTQVDEAHKNFVSRLLMRCASLSEREKRLAILLRLGFSSKEIGNLLNIETKSVEISRYRLRKKLKLERNENIVHFLQLL